LYAQILDSRCTHDQTQDFARFREDDPSQFQPVTGNTWLMLIAGRNMASIPEKR
jgi:hypothetical protein